VSWIADHRLVKIADLDGDAAFDICDRSKVAGMAIATDPNWRTFRKSTLLVLPRTYACADRAIFKVCLAVRVASRSPGRTDTLEVISTNQMR
jgi:hypothetical protein